MSKQLTQKQRILKLLQENPAGINSYGIARELALQLPTRIWELKAKGYDITSITKEDKSVDYILNAEPEVERKRVGWKFENNIAVPIYQ